jgi:hypothetical protein
VSGLHDQLQAVYNKKGRLDPPTLVNAARPKNHPLHDRFEWDDSIAGEAYRRVQAHDLIQSVMIVMRRDNGEETSVRAFHAVRRADSVRPSYEPIEKVVDDPLMLAMVRADMERDIVSLKKRYERFEEFAELVRKHLAA